MTQATTAGPADHQDAVQSVLEIRDMKVHFGGVKAVDGITLDVTPGKVFGILGPNGSGKSTLLAAVTRYVPLTAGSMRLAGEDYATIASTAAVARRGVARTFQTVRLLPDLTVRQNVELGADLSRRDRGWRAEVWGVRESADRDTVTEAIERAGIPGLDDYWPGELSYGLQRRVEIARAIASRPRLLLLDEPTAGMTHSERADISRLLRQLQAEGLTQVIVEHDVQMMIETCDWLFAMNFGRLIAEGPPEHVVRQDAVREAYLGKKWGTRARDH